MQRSPYVQKLPVILAPLSESGSNGVQEEREQGSGVKRKKIYLYRTVDGDMVASDTLLVPPQDEPPIIDSEPPQDQRPLLIPVILSIVALLTLVAFCILTPYQKPEVRETLRVPAILLPVKTFTTSVKVIPTGMKTYPATQAAGTLTITNGSILSEELPQGMILTGKDGVEIVTDTAIFIPPGNATSLGYATVSAHAVIPGARGNIRMLAIDQVEGTALFIRNLQPFTGGQNTSTTTFITPTDRTNALENARTRLTGEISVGILLHPCSEAIKGSQILQVSWTCQFVTYHIPSFMKVIHVRIMGNYLFIDVVFVARPKPFPGK
jgi:hypothetical protein